MSRFKVYIETSGAALSKTTEFLPLYALPFVPDIQHHPSFLHLFEPQWIGDIKTRVNALVSSVATRGASGKSRLQHLWTAARANQANRLTPAGGRDEYISAIQQQIAECEEREMQHIDRHNNLQREYHSLITTATELVGALESSVRGVPINPEQLLTICTKLNDHGTFLSTFTFTLRSTVCTSLVHNPT